MRFQSPDCRQHRVTVDSTTSGGDRVTTSATGTAPGRTVGPTTEFSLLFRITPGHADALRQALDELQNHPGYRPGDYDIPIVSIHEARFVMFDDDTRLAFFTSFDGSWDAYMDDFFNTGATLALFDATFRHTEGYEGRPDLAALHAFVLGDETGGAQVGLCTGPDGAQVQFTVGEDAGGEHDGIRAFAGPRWDPFFFDARAALQTVATGELAFTDHGTIFMDGKNVLTLVVEIDCARFLGGSSLVGVIAETLTRGKFNVRIERVGRPEVKNMLLAPTQFDQVNSNIDIRDLYNMEDAFHLAESYKPAYLARLNANLAFWDGLDGKADWSTNGKGDHPLTSLWLADYLIVDASRPYAEHGSFLEPERSARAGRPHETCGGRALNDDSMDTFFTFIVTGGNGPPIRDGIDASTRPGTQTFPYLQPANPDPPEQPEHH